MSRSDASTASIRRLASAAGRAAAKRNESLAIALIRYAERLMPLYLDPAIIADAGEAFRSGFHTWRRWAE